VGLALPAHAGTLFVYHPSSATARALQSELEAKLPGVEVTVFGRLSDFEGAVSEQSPEAVLAPTPVLEAQGLSPSLRGSRGGQTEASYCLVSVGPVPAESLGEHMVGAIDLLGRSGMPAFVQGLAGSPEPPKVKRVTQQADLLPLLQFELATAVVLDKDSVPSLLDSTQLELQVQDLTGSTAGRVAVWATPAGQPVLDLIGRFDPATNDLFGVDAWSAP
jgi:hypothetical protein